MTFLATSATVVFFFTNTQSLNTALEPAAPDEKVVTFRTGKTGTKPSNSAALDKT